MNPERVIYLSIDTEFHTPKRKVIQLTNKKGKPLTPITKVEYDYVLIGVYDPQMDAYFHTQTAKDFWNLVQKISEIHKCSYVVIYSFFLYAELQFLLYPIFKDWNIIVDSGKKGDNLYIVKDDKNKCMIQPLGNSLLVDLVYKGINCRFIDIMKLTNALSLKELVRGVIGENSKYESFKEGRSSIDRWKEKDIIEYNKMDCFYQFVSLLEFEKLCKRVFKDESIKVISYDIYTFGQVLINYFRKYDTRLILYWGKMVEDMTKLQNYLRKIKDREHTPAELRAIYESISKTYKGGGFIHNLVPCKPYVVEDSKMIDFISLYPVSLLIALNHMPSSMLEVKHIKIDDSEYMNTKLKEYLDAPKYFFAYVQYEWMEGVPLVPLYVYSKFEGEEQREVVYARQGTTWIGKDELKQFLKMGMRVVKCKELLVWDDFEYKEIKNIIKRLIEERINFKESNPSLAYILKIALNSLYGKFAQQVSITSISNMLVASMITSISRYLMARIIDMLWQRGVKIFHIATDSLIVNTFQQEYIEEVHKEVESRSGIKLKKIVNEEVAGTCYIFSLKHYYYPNTKYAHLGIHLPKDINKFAFANMLVEHFDKVIKSIGSCYQGYTKHKQVFTSSWKRVGYLKIKDYIKILQSLPDNERAKALELLCSTIEEDYTYIAKGDLKLNIDGEPFMDIDEYITIKDRVRKNIDTIKKHLEGKVKNKMNIVIHKHNLAI